MQWQYDGEGYSTANVEIGDSASEAMKALCEHLVNDVLPRNKDVDWDYLLVDISSDSGQFVVLPAAASTPYRVEKAGCQVIFQELSTRYFERLNSMDEDDFVRCTETDEYGLFNAFRTAAHETEL